MGSLVSGRASLASLRPRHSVARGRRGGAAAGLLGGKAGQARPWPVMLHLPCELWAPLLVFDAGLAARGGLATAATALRLAMAAAPAGGRQLSVCADWSPRFLDAAGRPLAFCRLGHATEMTIFWEIAERRCRWCGLLLSPGAPVPCPCLRCAILEGYHRRDGGLLCWPCEARRQQMEEEDRLWAASNDADEHDGWSDLSDW